VTTSPKSRSYLRGRIGTPPECPPPSPRAPSAQLRPRQPPLSSCHSTAAAASCPPDPWRPPLSVLSTAAAAGAASCPPDPQTPASRVRLAALRRYHCWPPPLVNMTRVLKGQCHEIFDFRFFQKSVSPSPRVSH
jgi:hypothetical protein